jgi:hypothetical protein
MRLMREARRKTAKSIHAMLDAVTVKPTKPKTAAINAITKRVIAKLSMTLPLK